jgi:transposase
MRQLRQILRLKYEKGLSHRAIARACSVGLGTIVDYLRRAEKAELSWSQLAELDDAALDATLFPKAPAAGTPRPLPDFAYLHQELRKAGVTLQLLWHEYIEAHPSGYHYTQFCVRYRQWRKKLNPSMRQVHRAGEKQFVDYSGKKPHIVDRSSGEVVPVDLFVGVLGASNYTYAEVTPSQELPYWIGSHIRMLEYFGGGAEIWIPDNLKSGVTKACNYEPLINQTYEECAQHYGAVVIPARSGKPKDKAKVEAGVLMAQRWILAVLRNLTCFSIVEMNRAIWEKLDALNDRPMKQLGVSRRELFERIERPALIRLPAERYELAEWVSCRVNIDYHVAVAHNFYSVPYQLVHEEVEARYTHTTVEVLFKGKRVASHRRLRGKGNASTRSEHMPAAHRAHAEWSPSRLIRWAEETGPTTGRVVAQILSAFPHPEQGYRSCLGIIRLSRSYGAERVEAACRRAEHLGSCRYRTVKNILDTGMDRQPLEDQQLVTSSVPTHDNIRGAEYYGNAKEPKC